MGITNVPRSIEFMVFMMNVSNIQFNYTMYTNNWFNSVWYTYFFISVVPFICPVFPCLVSSSSNLTRRALFSAFVFCLVLFCPALSCPAFSLFALSCFIFPFYFLSFCPALIYLIFDKRWHFSALYSIFYFTFHFILHFICHPILIYCVLLYDD